MSDSHPTTAPGALMAMNAATVHDPLAPPSAPGRLDPESMPGSMFFVEAAKGKTLAEIIGPHGAELLGEGGGSPSLVEAAHKACSEKLASVRQQHEEARKSAYEEGAPDDASLSVRGGVSRYLESDPFSGFYWTQEQAGDGQAKADTWPIASVENLSVLSSIYAWSSILPCCGNAIARNVEMQGANDPKETVTVKEGTPEALKKAVRAERRLLKRFLEYSFGSEDDWVSGLSKARRDREGIGMRALEALRTPPPHLRLPLGSDSSIDATATASGALFGLFGGTSPMLSVPAVMGMKSAGDASPADPAVAALYAQAAAWALNAVKSGQQPDWSKVDYRGRPYGLRHVEAETLRWCPACAPILSPVWWLIDGDEDDPENLLIGGEPVPRYEKAYETRRWRLIIHERRGQYVYFQQFGDPRIVDSRTGAVIGNYALGQWPDMKVFPPSVWANELLIDINPEPTWSPYGAPWWWGDQELVLGLMGAEAAVHSGIVSPKIPRVIISVLGTAVAKQIQRQKEISDKARENAPEKTNEVLYLEVTPPGDIDLGEDGGNKGRPVSVDQIKVIPDDMYGPFIDRARKIIRGTKGLSNKALGESEDDSFASAESSLIMDDHQVYGPERRRTMNWLDPLWHAMRVRFHQMTLRGPKIMSSDQREKWLRLAKELGADTPERSRQLISREIGEDWPQIEGDWGDQPWDLTLAAAKMGQIPGQEPQPGAQHGLPGGTSGAPQAPTAQAGQQPEAQPPAKPSAASASSEGNTPGTERGRAEKGAGGFAAPDLAAAQLDADQDIVVALRALKGVLVQKVALQQRSVSTPEQQG